MNQEFLATFLRVAKEVTGAERGMAVNTELEIQPDAIGVDERLINNASFIDLAQDTLRDCLQKDETIVTNNMITDPSEAPITNTNFSDLRVVVAVPVRDVGALYLDQHIRRGVIDRDKLDRLMRVANAVVSDGNLGISDDDLRTLYQNTP